MVRNASQTVIRISDKNPHLLSFRGKEILLITSAEHYGAVVNGRFDYRKYLDKLAAYRMNYTRIYPGAVALRDGQNRKNDTLGPGEHFITPWARSEVPGYFGGGSKFDLDKWNDVFFTRLDDFLKYAEKLGIFVEICFFNSQHRPSYVYSPLHADANIQGVGCDNHADFETLKDARLVGEQLRFIEKLIVETNKYDNIIYEFCDEPTMDGTKSAEAWKWLDVLIDHAIRVEGRLPKQHLFAQQVMVGVDFSDDDRIAISVGQYAGSGGRQVGGYDALEQFYHREGKPIEMNETVSCLSDPVFYERDVVAASRIEAWEFMVGGGAAFNQLNGCFTVTNPGGDNEENHRILGGLRNLRSFIEAMDYAGMKRDGSIRELSVGGKISGISGGGTYAYYMHHSFHNYRRWRPTHYVPIPGEYETAVTLALEPGEYNVEFIDPADLRVISNTKITSGDGETTVQCPRYRLDIAIKIKKI